MRTYLGVTFRENRPVPSANEVAAVEMILGFPLPSSLGRYLTSVNGGRPDKTGVLLPNGDELEVEVFLPVLHELYPGGTIEGTYERMVVVRKLLPANLLPFGVGGGGDYWCIDLASEAVVFFAMDHDDAVSSAATTVAPALADFFALLRTPSEMGW